MIHLRTNTNHTMKTIALIAIAICLASCGPIAPTAYNPLDNPGQQPTAVELHSKNIANITGDPSRQ
jgi:hypothetical protein